MYFKTTSIKNEKKAFCMKSALRDGIFAIMQTLWTGYSLSSPQTYTT